MKQRRLSASYTVEAAGVMAIVFFSIMVLLNQAFHVHAETVGSFVLHDEVERERHQVENQYEAEISRKAQGARWSREITAAVFRPEESLRLWSLAEEKE